MYDKMICTKCKRKRSSNSSYNKAFIMNDLEFIDNLEKRITAEWSIDDIERLYELSRIFSPSNRRHWIDRARSKTRNAAIKKNH